MAYWIKANGEVKEVHPADGVSFKLDELHGYVGGYLEAVRQLRPIRVVTMFQHPDRDATTVFEIDVTNDMLLLCNEEAKLVSDPPFNEVASVMYELYPQFDWIAGDVILVHERWITKRVEPDGEMERTEQWY